MSVQIKRIYEPAAASDGTRVLVDRLWPRGISKDAAGKLVWLKDIAPSPKLRIWFGHDPGRWAEFQKRYRGELKENDSALAELRALAHAGRVTLLYAARDEDHNHALVLRDCLSDRKS
jgi:uncharacterized protein YeaO (DUF488 family)